MKTAAGIESADARRLAEVFGFSEAVPEEAVHDKKPLSQWKMEEDDAPLLRYLYRNLAPRRHLEFGTWQGEGLLYCLEECQAACWTINLMGGCGSTPDGSYIYANDPQDAGLQAWARRIGMREERYYHTDSIGFIGRRYLEAGYGPRVCQIYADSRDWDTRNYPAGFFDSALIDGSHERETVISDTLKALPLLRSGGLMLWHDFCPPVSGNFGHTREVAAAIEELLPALEKQMDKIFWINPSWILAGIKK